MDEPILVVRDGAIIRRIPLTELIVMVDAARDIATAAISERNQEAVATAEAAMRQEDRCKAAVSGFLLNHYMVIAQAKEQAKVVVAPQSVAGEASTPAAAVAPGASPGAASAPGGPCSHPPDVACPNCATAHMEARNARKRTGARA